MNANLSDVKTETLSKKETLILYFFIYAFLGWCLETMYAFMVFGNFVKRGFLFGPICPIYGFGAIILIISLQKVKNNNFIKFITAMILFSAFEFVASLLLELLFHQRWWDYSYAFLNIQGRICLSFSIVWGILGLIFTNHIHLWLTKKVNKLLEQVPLLIQKFLIYSCGFIYFFDTLFSVLKNI